MLIVIYENFDLLRSGRKEKNEDWAEKCTLVFPEQMTEISLLTVRAVIFENKNKKDLLQKCVMDKQ